MTEILADVSNDDYAWSMQINIEDPEMKLLVLRDGWFALRHVCDRGKRGVIICSPELTRGPDGHKVTGSVSVTITPSISCPDCGTHGFITNGWWKSA